jgi:FMN phosphatase YigB (HAD superfamily)
MKAILFDRGNTLVQFGESDYEAGLKEILASLDSPEALDLAELDRFEDEFRALSLYDYFDTVVCSSEIVFRKPDRAMFEVALRSLKVSPSEAMFIGDDYHADIIGAKKVGMKAVWLNPNHHPNPGEVAPDYDIAGLKEILAFPEIKSKTGN